MQQINNFEKHITQNGTIIKVLLHLSKEGSVCCADWKKKNWKFSVGDLKERDRWDDYMHYYEEAINNTSSEYAPWYVVLLMIRKWHLYLGRNAKHTDIKEPEMDDTIKANMEMYKEMLKKEN
jgi:polyphosphate kinase 2 (PPK2 family)